MYSIAYIKESCVWRSVQGIHANHAILLTGAINENIFVLLGTNVYLSPTDTSCVNIDYPKELDGDLDGYERARIRK